MRFAMTESSVSVVVGGVPRVVARDHALFTPLCTALALGNFRRVEKLLESPPGLADQLPPGWTLVEGKDGQQLEHLGKRVPAGILRRAEWGISNGVGPLPALRFWWRTQRNPGKPHLETLMAFMDHAEVGLDGRGYLLVHKGVNHDFTDRWTGTINNSPGQVVQMDRSGVCADPKIDCAPGLHVAALSYAKGYPRVLDVRVDPRDVVCVPLDQACRKMRVCRYEVLREHGEPVPATVPERPKLRLPVGYRWLRGEDAGVLMSKDLATLRGAATHGLKMVGASHVPGGKAALVARMLVVLR